MLGNEKLLQKLLATRGDLREMPRFLRWYRRHERIQRLKTTALWVGMILAMILVMAVIGVGLGYLLALVLGNGHVAGHGGGDCRQSLEHGGCGGAD